MGDYLAIIRRNLFTPIVVAIFLLAAALLYVQEYRDAWFITVIITVNSLIGIVQEFRARHALRKLELLSAPKARLVIEGKVTEVAYDQLRAGQTIELLAGDEVPADAEVITGRGLEVDESMLTGESVSVDKTLGDPIYAATTITAGSARAKVVAVGDKTKAGKISSTLKRYSPELTPLQRAIQKAISTMTFGAIGLAVLIFISYYLSGQNAIQILKTITASAVAVVPEGLLLASSLLLAYGSIRLVQAKVLPQKLSAIEAMALLNMLCVDKTGTLTSDKIKLDRVEAFGKTDTKLLSSLSSLVAKEASGGNDTGQAILKDLSAPDKYELLEVMAFSSSRKTSAVRVKLYKEIFTLILGAPESVSSIVNISKQNLDKINEWTAGGQRVLALARLADDKTPLKEIKTAKGQALGAIVLTNSLRAGVEDAVRYLQNQNVAIRVISGDNPLTVKHVAEEVGIKDPDKVITGAELSKLNGKDFNKAIDDHTIFARVLPEQKEKIIQHFQKRKLFTGMVGDGVNDALALKKANLGVAMYAGATSTRRVADIILLNNSFTSLPMGLRLGNQIMQAIEVIATLFFHKIIYSVVLLVITILMGMTYPFAPRHVTFMNMFLVTMPTIMWTLFPPVPRHRVNPKSFWRDTLFAVAPIAVVTGLTVAFTYWIMSYVYPERPMHVATMTVLTATFFGIYMVFLVGQMLGVTVNKRSRFARLLYLCAVIFVAVTSFGLGFLRDFFDFTAPTIWILWPAVGVIALAAVVQRRIAKNAAKKFQDSLI